MAQYVQLTVRKYCAAIALAKEGFSTKLNCRHSTDSRVIQLKHETGDIERKKGQVGKDLLQ